jgi:uncharacterized membrane protein YkvA (DUF1232 family)
MSETNSKYLEAFSYWLKNLGEDVQYIFNVLSDPGQNMNVRRELAGGINYIFKSLDLIPDGIDDIGYLDDAFILRLSVKFAMDTGISEMDGELKSQMDRLAWDTGLIRELLGDDLYGRLDRYAGALKDGAARGRTVDEILNDEAVFNEFSSEVHNFIKEYQDPEFSDDEKNLIKLKAFLDAKLPG